MESTLKKFVAAHTDTIEVFEDEVQQLASEMVIAYTESKKAEMTDPDPVKPPPDKEFFLTFRDIRMPLQYKSTEDEVNFMAILNLLDFGRYYWKQVKAVTKRSVPDTMKYGCMAMYISNDKLDADFLLSVTVASISKDFQIPVTQEKKVMEGVYQDENGPLWPLAESMRKQLNEVGRVLKSRQVASLGDFITEAASRDTSYGSAVALVKLLSDTFESFRDETQFEGETISFSRKATLLVMDLFERFGNPDKKFVQPDPRFVFTDMDRLTPVADPMLIRSLELRKMTLFNKELEQRIKDGFEITSEEEIAARVAGVFSVILTTQEMNKTMGPVALVELEALLRKCDAQANEQNADHMWRRNSIHY